MADMEITRDERVLGTDGTELGRVVHVIVDTHTKQLTDLVVAHNGTETVVPVENVMRGSNGAITMRGTAQGLSFQRDLYHEVNEDALDAMPATPSARGVTVEDADEDSVTIMDNRGATTTRTTETTRTAAVPTPPVRTQQTTRTDTARTTETVGNNDTIKVPVVEEQLRAGVREREAGVFRLAKTVVQEQQSIDVPVRREEVYITERAVNRPATEADLAQMDRDISVPVTQQEVVTSKQAVVTGEVEVRKDVVTETQRVSDTVRREEVHVVGSDNARVHTEGMTTGATGAMANFTTEQRTRYETMDQTGRERYLRFSDAERMDYDRRNPLEKAADAVKGAAKDVKNAVDGDPRT